jgi:epoxide hydrolase 4
MELAMHILEEVWSHRFITTNGIKLHYVTQGEGPLMLLLHGFPEFWYSWRHQIREFSKEYKVVALDLRGYNDSEKPEALSSYRISEVLKDIKGVIRDLGYDCCVLVGHDWGGSIAWTFAYDYPEIVKSLIVLNAPHLARFIEGLCKPKQLIRSWYIFFFQLPWLPELLLRAGDYRLIIGMFSGMMINKSALTPRDFEFFKKAASKPGALTAMLNYYRNVFQSNMVRRSILEVPTLMIWGESDAALDKDLTYGTDSYVSDFQIEYIPNCSHWVQQEQPELVNQLISRFLEKENL